MPYMVIIIITITLLRFWRTLKKQQEQAGIRGWVKDQDLDGRGKKIYRDQHTGVVCKPDVVEEENRVIEFKSNTVNEGRPRSVDVLQLALQMKITGAREGQLRYANNKCFNFLLDSLDIQNALIKIEAVVKAMKESLRQGTAPRATPTKRRCAVCTFGKECSEAIRQ